MKQNKFFILAAALAFVACSSDDNYTAKEKASQAPQEVSFGAYLNRGTTRAGDPGVLTTNGTDGIVSLQTAGFGVFSYYSDNQFYGSTSTPNFMYNQKVSESTWTYSPIKYWPNEFGGEAVSDGEDMLTFFAYAPYVEVEPRNGRPASDETGIVGLPSNSTPGDPYVKYIVNFDPDNSIDLCWGVAAAAYTSSVTTTSPKNNIAAGAPYIDVVKPEVAKATGTDGGSNRINFDFKHALASLNVQIDADVNKEDHETTTALDGLTRIWVRSVTFEGFADRGSLNLNSKYLATPTPAEHSPNWYELSSANNLIRNSTTTIYDGRRDGREGMTEAASENPKGLNAKIIQDAVYEYTAASGETAASLTTSTTGVTKDPINLFDATLGEGEGAAAAALAKPVFVIPTNEALKVTIVYDVETADPNVAGYLSDGKTKGVTVENKITKEIKTGTGESATALKIEAGKKYTLKLHLGMTSVEFEAAVSPWTATEDQNVWLPINKE